MHAEHKGEPAPGGPAQAPCSFCLPLAPLHCCPQGGSAWTPAPASRKTDACCTSCSITLTMQLIITSSAISLDVKRNSARLFLINMALT